MAKNSGGTRSGGSAGNPNGRPGTYTLYRIGGNRTDSGLIFTSPQFEYSDHYGVREFYRGQETLTYQVQVKNPLVIELDRDVQNDNTYFTDAAFKRLIGGKPSAKQLENDRKIAQALQAAGYDALMYKGSDGLVREVAVLPSMLGEGRKTRESDVFSRRWGQTRAEYIKEWTERYISWGNPPAQARKFALESARNEEREWKGRR